MLLVLAPYVYCQIINQSIREPRNPCTRYDQQIKIPKNHLEPSASQRTGPWTPTSFSIREFNWVGRSWRVRASPSTQRPGRVRPDFLCNRNHIHSDGRPDFRANFMNHRRTDGESVGRSVSLNPRFHELHVISCGRLRIIKFLGLSNSSVWEALAGERGLRHSGGKEEEER